jgi:hypothetical protein
LSRVEAVAADGGVRHVRPALRPMIDKINTSAGDVAHRANLARAGFGVDGTGVKVGVLSDSVEQLASLQASGDLPAVTVLPGQAGSGDSEGTAMLEIVHDLAPGAQLFFATAFNGEGSFAANIRKLRDAGCKVIVDDVGYFSEGVFQDDLIAKAVNEVTADGVAYFSSAGNSGNLSSGTPGAWEGNFVNGGAVPPLGTVHNFGGGNKANRLTLAPGGQSPIVLQWSDPLGASGNDYDLCAFDSTGNTLLGCSDDTQDGNDDPVELLDAPPAGSLLAIFSAGASPRFLHLSASRGHLSIPTSGQTSGHSAAADAFSIAAVNVATAAGGAFSGGAANPVETFSSDGPRRIFFNPNGTAITPGNFLATGGTLRQKPDFAAADGVATASGAGFNPFFGTSAAAPHAAAIAALMFDAKPTATLAEIRAAFTATALDIMAAGTDRDSGVGILNAQAAVQAVLPNTAPCVRDANTACLQSSRFEAKVTFTNDSNSGNASVMSFGGQRAENTETAFYFFTSATNFEMGLKVLDGCGLNNKFWVFLSGLTDQGWTATIRDTQTGASKSYSNALHHLSQTVADTTALSCN